MMARGRDGGFSLLELVVVIALIGTMLSIALYKLVRYVHEAERVAVMTFEAQMRNVLLTEAAKRLLAKQSAPLAELDQCNPIRLLLDPPVNYVGELDEDQMDLADGRQWYFDATRRELVYRRGNWWAERAGREIRYQVRLAYKDRDGDGRFVDGRDEFQGVRFARLRGQ